MMGGTPSQQPFVDDALRPMVSFLAAQGFDPAKWTGAAAPAALERGRVFARAYAAEQARAAPRAGVDELALAQSRLRLLEGLYGRESVAGGLEAVSAGLGRAKAASAKIATDEFSRLLAGTDPRKVPSEELDRMRGVQVLLVGGFSGSEIDRATKSLGMPKQYLGTPLDWLREQGIPVKVIKTRTQRPSSVNAPIIARAIMKSRKPVLLVGHSLGARHVKAALVELYYAEGAEVLRQKVAGVALVQGPLKGLSSADEIMSRPSLRSAVGRRLEAADGSLDVLREMTPAFSRAYDRVHEAALRRIAAEIRIVTFGSWIDAGYVRLLRPLYANVLGRAAFYGLPFLLPKKNPAAATALMLPLSIHAMTGAEKSDGVVELKSTSWRGTKAVTLRGVNHLDLFMPPWMNLPREVAGSLRSLAGLVPGLGLAVDLLTGAAAQVLPLAPSLNVDPLRMDVAMLRTILPPKR